MIKKKVVIIDDEPLARQLIREFLSAYDHFEIVAEGSDGFDGLKIIQNLKPNLLFLDVRMPKINGFEMLELLDELPFVIFTTAFDEYAMKAFDSNALDYLLKPFSQERFDKALSKFLDADNNKSLLDALRDGKLQQESTSEDRILVKIAQEIRILPCDEVSFIESYDDYIKIHSNENTYIKKKTMTYYENNLDPKKFIRIHRSYLVNIRFIKMIHSQDKDALELELKSGQRLSVSRNGFLKLKEIWGI